MSHELSTLTKPALKNILAGYKVTFSENALRVELIEQIKAYRNKSSVENIQNIEEKKERTIQSKPRLIEVIEPPPLLGGGSLKLINVKLTFKEAKIKQKVNISLSISELEELLKRDKIFIDNIRRNLVSLYKFKIDKYRSKIKETDELIERQKGMIRNIKALSHIEADKYQVESNADTNIIFKARLLLIIDIIEKRLREIDNIDSQAAISKIREKLYDAVDIIKSIVGESREDIRRYLTLQIYSLSKSADGFEDVFLNIIIAGNAGIGKTYIATKIGQVYNKIGILITDIIEIITARDLIAGYVGQTAIKTLKQLHNSLEGVLFIDEAYQLTPCKGEDFVQSYASEAISEIVNYLDKNIGSSMIIAAGYTEKMRDCFLTFNEGMPRRFAEFFILKPYSAIDLFKILENMIFKRMKKELQLTENEKNYIYSLITELLKQKPESFKYMAGDILNLSQIFVTYARCAIPQWNKDTSISIINAIFTEYLSKKDIHVELSSSDNITLICT